MIKIPKRPDANELNLAEARSAAFDLISIKKAAAILGVSLRTMRYRQSRGTLPSRTKHGRQMRYSKADIEGLASQASQRSE